MRFFEVRWRRRYVLAVCATAVMLSGCSTLASSGPTGHEILRSAAQAPDGRLIRIVEVTDLAAVPASDDKILRFAEFDAPPTDLVGPGDVLDIAIYEAGVTLFGSSGRGATEASGFDPSAKAEKLPPTRVDDNGDIRLPYAGRLHVAGKTVSQIELQIRTSLRGFSQNPQILVTIREDITNSVIVGGEIGRPGRLVLSTNRETLADAIALAGGYRGDPKDLSVRVLRHGADGEFRLSDVLNGPAHDMRIYPGDRITILRAPRSFSVMGAPGRVQQIAFSGSSISLAEAIATAGGVDANLGDPKAIFLFRIVPGENGAENNVVYHINMMTAGSYFLTQRFPMRDKDVLYFGNARANQPVKLVQVISQLFSPIVAVGSGIQAVR